MMVRTTLSCFYLAALLAVSTAELSALKWSDCGSDPSAVVVENIGVTPMPLLLPGNMQLSIHARLLEQLNSVAIHLAVKRHTFLINIPIPCLAHVGSCTYQDSCTVLTQMETENWAGIAADLGHQIRALLASKNITQLCPINPRRLDVDNYVLRLPKIPAILSWFAEGDYSARVTATDPTSGAQKLCVDLELSVKEFKEPCSGFLCSIFG